MKLKAVAVYQAVKFNKRQEMFFSAEKPGMAGLEITFDAKGGFIHIIGSPDPADGLRPEIYVFPTNVAYAVPLTSKEKTDADPKLVDVKPRG